MKPVIFVTLLFFLQLSNAQKNGPYETYHKNGQLKTVGQYENDKKIGDWKDYHPNGNLRQKYSYTKGKKNKELKFYFKDGNIHFETINERGDYIRKGYFKCRTSCLALDPLNPQRQRPCHSSKGVWTSVQTLGSRG